MDEARRDFFKELLESKRDTVIQESASTKEAMGNQKALYADPIDRASEESNRNFTLRLRDRERKLLKKVDEALERLERGEFGICEECGEPIEDTRLKSRPVTTLCIDCKEEQERIEKMEL